MKKSSLIILIVAILLCFTACTPKEKESTFRATVLQNNVASLLVEPEKGSNEMKSADKISVSAVDSSVFNSQGKTIKLSDIKTGEKVEVTYGGEILESYPAQIPNCFKIKVIE